MAKETGGEHVTPFDRGCLVVEKAEMISDKVTRLKLRSEKYSIEIQGATFAPRMSLHYYCTPRLAPRPGTYVRVYLEEISRDAQVPDDE